MAIVVHHSASQARITPILYCAAAWALPRDLAAPLAGRTSPSAAWRSACIQARERASDAQSRPTLPKRAGCRSLLLVRLPLSTEAAAASRHASLPDPLAPVPCSHDQFCYSDHSSNGEHDRADHAEEHHGEACRVHLGASGLTAPACSLVAP